MCRAGCGADGAQVWGWGRLLARALLRFALCACVLRFAPCALCGSFSRRGRNPSFLRLLRQNLNRFGGRPQGQPASRFRTFLAYEKNPVFSPAPLEGAQPFRPARPCRGGYGCGLALKPPDRLRNGVQGRRASLRTERRYPRCSLQGRPIAGSKGVTPLAEGRQAPVWACPYKGKGGLSLIRGRRSFPNAPTQSAQSLPGACAPCSVPCPWRGIPRQ